MKSSSSEIYKISEEDFKKIVADSKSGAAVFRALELRYTGASKKIFDRRVLELEIDTSHFNLGFTGKRRGKLDFNLVFCLGSHVNSSNTKTRVLSENLIDYVCEDCGNKGLHNGKVLNLQLDHKNGVGNDNRVENLRFLCPNCHSQTETFCRGIPKLKIPKLCLCGKAKAKSSKQCSECASKARGMSNRKVKDRPCLEILLEDVKNLGYRGTGKKYGVSDVTIKKWTKAPQ